MIVKPLLIIGCVVLLTIGSPDALGADDGHGEAGHKHVAIFLGAGQEEDKSSHTHSAEAVGVEFEYRLSDEWGVGGVIEGLDVHGKSNSTVVIPFSFHFGSGFRAFAGPGYEFNANAGHDKALVRIGLGYEFHINEHWTIAPEILNDFLDGDGDTWLAGIAVGYGF